ncbi:MAG TPA: serine hydrolase domain-containing protein [Actinomycetota bacterium]|nr:serine hydrolase domain-containing protein [Actinomycetota bacterium]
MTSEGSIRWLRGKTLLLVWILLTACTGSGGRAPTVDRPEPEGSQRSYALGAFPERPSAPLPTPLANQLQSILAVAVASGRLPGITASVIVADVGLWLGAAGTADGSTDLVPEAQFHTGSVTKTVIAAQVLRLIEVGAMSMDDRVAKHLPPDLRFDTNGATVQELLSNRSGIASVDFWAFVDELGYDRHAVPIHPDHVWSTERYLELLEALPTAKDTPPGTTFEYSNTNFDLLIMAIEHATGEPMAKVLRGDVLARPGLERMIWQTEEHPSAPVAAPLSRRWLADVTAAHEAGGGYLPSAFDGRDSLVADSPSLARWVYDLFGGRILSDQSLIAMSRAGGDGYGLGLWNDTREWDAGTTVLSGSGILMPAYSSIFYVLPEEGIVVVAQSNLADSFRDFNRLTDVAHELVDAVRA